MKRMQHGKIETQKECNTEKEKHEKSAAKRKNRK